MWIWIGFLLLVIACLVLDLGVFNKEDHVIEAKEAAKWTALWVSLALVFSLAIWWLYKSGNLPHHTNLSAGDAVINYLSGYFVELSLSIDNVFVIAVIFTSFKIPRIYQHRVLFWGILGAIVFRGLMIFFGIALIKNFNWMIYVFGAFLLYTAYSMLKGDDDKDPQDSWMYKQLKKIFPLTHEIHGHSFIIRQNAKRYITPLLMALIVIELTDVMFALDSIPAVLAITQDDFIVFSSNILAILGLRSMFFLIVSMLSKFRLINYSLAIILAFVGIKMLLSDYWHAPTWISLVVIVACLGLGILASVIINPSRKEKRELREMTSKK